MFSSCSTITLPAEWRSFGAVSSSHLSSAGYTVDVVITDNRFLFNRLIFLEITAGWAGSLQTDYQRRTLMIYEVGLSAGWIWTPNLSLP